LFSIKPPSKMEVCSFKPIISPNKSFIVLMLSTDKVKTEWIDEKFSEILVIETKTKECIFVGNEVFAEPFRNL